MVETIRGSPASSDPNHADALSELAIVHIVVGQEVESALIGRLIKCRWTCAVSSVKKGFNGFQRLSDLSCVSGSLVFVATSFFFFVP